MIHPANLSASPLPGASQSPLNSCYFTAAQSTPETTVFGLLSVLNKKSKKICIREVEKKRSSKVGLGVLTVEVGPDLKGENPHTLAKN